MAKKNLTRKEKAFCELYVFENYSQIKAYQEAYNVTYEAAHKNAWEVMKRPHIKEYIAALQKQVFEAACITAEKVGLKLSEIAFAAKGDEYYTASSQLKALDLLQKQLGLQTQKIDADVNTEINITIEE